MTIATFGKLANYGGNRDLESPVGSLCFHPDASTSTSTLLLSLSLFILSLPPVFPPVGKENKCPLQGLSLESVIVYE